MFVVGCFIYLFTCFSNWPWSLFQDVNNNEFIRIIIIITIIFFLFYYFAYTVEPLITDTLINEHLQ
jgi:hypothetical protein